MYCIVSYRVIAGLSLKTQELTAMFLAVRLYCSFVMEYDIHRFLDLSKLAATLWFIYMIRFRLKSSYMEDNDNFQIYYVVSLVFVALICMNSKVICHKFSYNLYCNFFCRRFLVRV